MRPVRLEMNGFASFRGETVVDFDGADYFALVGPTGSGKSTVIDAMVFALFGSAPRWGRANSVQYALAPTTARATVRLLFDVGQVRYRVAREVRRVGQQIQQKTATLEKLDDRAATSATTDEVEVIASEVRDVTPAVEELLGLSFDDFTKAVVLPQGRFAEFLSATVGERQEILLKLLGAHQYDIVMRAAGARRSAADLEMQGASGRIAELGGATREAADEAAARVAALTDLAARVEHLSASVEGARAASEEAAKRVARAEADADRLAAVRIPGGLTELAARSSAVRDEAERLRAAASAAEAAYGAARADLEAGGNRSDLERARDRHTELADLSAALPGLAAMASAAVEVAERSGAQRSAAEERWSTVFEAKGAAARAVEEASAGLSELSARRAAVAGLTPPEGVHDLGKRLDEASDAVIAATGQVTRAEEAEDAARAGLAALGDPVELTALVARCDRAAELGSRAEELEKAVTDAVEGLARARVAEAEAESTHAAARSEADTARARGSAAALRAALEVGHACPVCETTVATLPAPIDQAEAEAADGSVLLAERARDAARQATARAEADARHQGVALTEARAQLADALPDGADAVHLRAEAAARLESIGAARIAVESAQSVRTVARQALATARSESARLDGERRDGVQALRAARAHMAPFGAPVGDAESLQESWRELTSWAEGALADLDAVDQPKARAACERAAAADEAARIALEEASGLRSSTVSADDAARAARLRAESALEAASIRIGSLRGQLADAPSASGVAAALESLTALEASEKEALREQQAAARERDGAVAAERDLRGELASADRLLRETREPLVSLGAPAVDPSDLPAAWATLAAWAEQSRGSADEELVAARAAADSAAPAVSVAEAALVAEVVGEGLEVGAASEVAVALATERARAADRLARIEAGLARVATLNEERAAAEERRQVAGMLAEHLSAKKFQRWLAGAALDTLVEAASSSLLELSGGQFTLAHDKGEFYVIDHTDADARRSVRTLSGGETFQASLALALALSAELSSMSSTAASLDSIFLDEGFGSLDPDSLEVVASTLERLAQGDRLVGIVTHVAGLAERVPTRFVVSRSSRTSSVTREG